MEACPLKKRDINSLDFVVNRLFMKLLKTSDINIVRTCQHMFGFELLSVLLDRRTRKFLEKNEKFMSWGEYSKIYYSLIVMFFTKLITVHVYFVFAYCVFLFVCLLCCMCFYYYHFFGEIKMYIYINKLKEFLINKWHSHHWLFACQIIRYYCVYILFVIIVSLSICIIFVLV